MTKHAWTVGLVFPAFALIACQSSERKQGASMSPTPVSIATATATAAATETATAIGTATATGTGVAAAAEPPDDCTLDRAAIKGKLDTGAPSVRKVVASTFDAEKRHLTETVELTSGVTATYSIGGCHHYAYGYTWELPATEATDVRSYAKLARKLLDETPLLSKDTGLGSALDGVATTEPARMQEQGREVWILPCGDPTCELSVERTGATMKISVNYDFGL